MNVSIGTDLALGKRQMSQAGNIREVDREVARAPWVFPNVPNLKLIRNEEEELDRTLPENRHRTQEKDRHKVPENDLRAKLRPLDLLAKDNIPDWQLKSFIRGGKEVWTCQLSIRNHICGTEGREWESQFAAKSATALEALAFLEQQEIASANCKFWDSEKKMMVYRWPQPFSHEARKDMLTHLTAVDDAKAARDVFTCLRDDLPAGFAITSQTQSPTEPESDSVYHFATGIAGLKRTSDRELKCATMQVSIRSNKTYFLPVVPRIVEPIPDDTGYPLNTGSAPVSVHSHKSSQTISSISHGEQRGITDIEDVAKYFELLMINKTPNEYIAEIHKLFLRFQESAARLCNNSSQRDELTSSLVWSLLNAHERVLSGGESSTWKIFSDIVQNLDMTGTTKLRTVSILYVQILEIATRGSISKETDELTSKLVRCILSAYEQASLGGSLRVWNILERIVRSGDTSGAVRYLAVLHNFDSLINDVVASGASATDHTDELTSHLMQNFLEAYGRVSPGGDLRAWSILQNQVQNASTMAQQELVAGIECTEYESSSSTPQNWCCENIVPECTMSEAGETGVHFADADLPPPKRNVKKNGQPTSNTTFTQGSSSVNLAIGHTSTAAPSREPNSSTQQSTVTKPAVLTSQGSNIPRPKTGFAFPSKPATKVPTNPIVAAHLGGAVTVGQSHGNAYGAPVSNTLSHNATPGPRLGVFHHNCVPSNANTSKPGDRLTNRGQTVPASHNTQAPQPRPSQIPRGGGFSGSRGGSMNAIFGNHLPAPSSSAVAASASTLRPTRASGRTTSTKGKSDGGRPSRGGR